MLRGKIFFLSLLGMGVLAAALGLAQMWLNFLEWEIFAKAMITLGVTGTLTSFLVAAEYDMASSKSRFMLLAAVALGVVLAGMIIAQLWWNAFDSMVFGKLVITDLVLLGLISFILAVSEDFGSNEKLKKEKYID